MINPRNNPKTRSSSRPIPGEALRELLKIELTSAGTPKEKQFYLKGQAKVSSAHVGILAGANGLAIVDLDNKNGKHGTKAFARLLHSVGLPTKVTTFATSTPNGGLHLFYRDPCIGLPSGTDIFGHLGVDLRVGNAYVRDIPSPGYVAKNSHPIESMPAPLVDYFSSKIAERDAKLKQRPVTAGGTIRHSVQGLLSAVHNAPGGQRNATLFWAISRVAEMAKPRHATAIRQLCRAAEDIGLGTTEIDKTVNSALGGAR